jgi:hypothetical protein
MEGIPLGVPYFFLLGQYRNQTTRFSLKVVPELLTEVGRIFNQGKGLFMEWQAKGGGPLSRSKNE